MSRRKKASRGGAQAAKASEATPDWQSQEPAFPPRPHKMLLIVTAVLLAGWMIFLAVTALQ